MISYPAAAYDAYICSGCPARRDVNKEEIDHNWIDLCLCLGDDRQFIMQKHKAELSIIMLPEIRLETQRTRQRVDSGPYVC